MRAVAAIYPVEVEDGPAWWACKPLTERMIASFDVYIIKEGNHG